MVRLRMWPLPLFSTRCHTLALVQSSGKVYSFGLGKCGQLGTGHLENAATPTAVRGQWLSSEALTNCVMEGEESGGRGGMVAREVFTGGDQSFTSLAICGEQVRGNRKKRIRKVALLWASFIKKILMLCIHNAGCALYMYVTVANA